MTRITLSLIVALLMGVNSSKAQSDSLYRPRWELSGSFFYSSSTESSVPRIQAKINRTYTWALEPGIAWFVNQYTDIGLDLRYKRIRQETTYDAEIEGGETFVDYSNYLLAAIGFGNNLPLSRSVWIYLNLKVGISWTHEGGDAGYGYHYSYWAPPRIIFPIVQGGLKYFLVSQCAVVLQLQYDQITVDPHSDFSVGIGLAVYL
jgi:hypothetical protein